MVTYEETIKSCENIALHDLIDIGGTLHEVVLKISHPMTTDFRIRCISVRSEQSSAPLTHYGYVTLANDLMIKTYK